MPGGATYFQVGPCCGCGCQVPVKITCNGAIVASATVAASQGGTVLETQNTAVNGIAVFNTLSPGNYTLTVTNTGHPAVTAVYAVQCNIQVNIDVCSCNFPFSITGCASKGVPGATVSLYSTTGTLLTSGITDANGNVSIPAGAAGVTTGGSFRVGVTGASGYAAYGPTGISISCGFTTVISLSTDTSHECCQPCAPNAIPTPLTLTDANGTYSFTAQRGQQTWVGCYVWTRPNVINTTCNGFGTFGMAINYKMICTSGGIQVTRSWAAYTAANYDYGDCTTANHCNNVTCSSTFTVPMPTSCVPFAISGTPAPVAGCAVASPDPVGGVVTISQ